ncbi:small heat shock protein [Aphelenchoides avenae]|nr:small heat shock protein [Aphelenchus avenae]KAH7704268.1 small heat shock protein [Aphelenchus avenae]
MNLEAPQFAGFTPEEVELNIYGDSLIVHLQHDESSSPHGEINRDVMRTFKLPADIDRSTIEPRLNEHGVLQIVAQKKR